MVSSALHSAHPHLATRLRRGARLPDGPAKPAPHPASPVGGPDLPAPL